MSTTADQLTTAISAAVAGDTRPTRYRVHQIGRRSGFGAPNKAEALRLRDEWNGRRAALIARGALTEASPAWTYSRGTR